MSSHSPHVSHLPAPVTSLDERLIPPFQTGGRVAEAIELLARAAGDKIAQEGRLAEVSITAGIIVGLFCGFGPGGILFGPIGAGLGAIFGASAGALISLLGKSKKISAFLNRPLAAMRALAQNDYRTARRLFGQCLDELEFGLCYDYFIQQLRSLAGETTSLPKSKLSALYHAALGAIDHVERGQGSTQMCRAVAEWPDLLPLVGMALAICQKEGNILVAREIRDLALKVCASDQDRLFIWERYARVDPIERNTLLELGRLYLATGYPDEASDTARIMAVYWPEDEEVTTFVDTAAAAADRGHLRPMIGQIQAGMDAVLVQSRTVLGVLHDERERLTELVEAVSRLREVIPGFITGREMEEHASLFAERVLALVEAYCEGIAPKAIENLAEEFKHTYAGWPLLCEEAGKFLLTGEFLWRRFQTCDLLDYAPVALEYAKCLETELHQLFLGFVSWWRESGKPVPRPDAISKKDSELLLEERLFWALQDGQKARNITIGSFPNILLDMNKSTSRPGRVIMGFQVYLSSCADPTYLLHPDRLAAFLTRVATEYRNGSAHIYLLPRERLVQFRTELFVDPNGHLWQLLTAMQPGTSSVR